MKIIPIVLVIILIVVVGGIIFYLESTSAGRETSSGWSSSDSAGSTAGQWGTELIATYTDGSTSALKILGFNLGGEEVAYITFKLSTRINGTGFNNCSVDLSGFYVSVELRDIDGLNIWDSSVEYGNVSTVPLDGEWHYVYEIMVTASDFDLDPNSYELEFSPTGNIFIQGLPDGVRYKSDLPLSRLLNFETEFVDPDDPETKWINVGFGYGETEQ